MRTIRRGFICTAAIFAIQLMLRVDAYGWWSAPPESSTHYMLGNAAVALVDLDAEQYPDIHRFKTQIRLGMDGSTNDTNAHGKVMKDTSGDPLVRDDAAEFDGGPIEAWWGTDSEHPYDGVLAQYKVFNFGGGEYSAYYYMAMMGHLIADQAVPAHAANIFHLQPWYELPADPTDYGDNLENVASRKSDQWCMTCHSTAPIKRIVDAIPRYYYHSTEGILDATITKFPTWKDGYDRNYWIASPSYEGKAFDENWGHYGEFIGTDINDYKHGYKDIYNGGQDTQDIVFKQFEQAVSYMAGFYCEASEKLPPLVKDFAFLPSTVADPFINTISGTDIALTILENRSQAVIVTIKAVERHGSQREYFVTNDGEVWDRKIVLLGDGESGSLPWEKSLSFNGWKGTGTEGGGAPEHLLPNGSYVMRVLVKDPDGNEVNVVYPDINSDIEPRNDTTRRFQIKSHVPLPPQDLIAATGDTSARLSWTAPTTNTDGSSLTDLASYMVYYDTDGPGAPYDGTGAGDGDSPIRLVAPAGGGTVEYTIGNLSNDGSPVYFIMVTAVDAAGNESVASQWVAVRPMEANWVPGEYQTIQEAIDEASSGGVVMVSPYHDPSHPEQDYYKEAVIHLKPGVTVRSERGPDKTIIQAPAGEASVIDGMSGGTLIGFTVRNAAIGVDLYFDNGATIKNNVITGNRTGIYIGAVDAATEVVNNTIVANEFAGLTIAYDGNAMVKNNIIAGNGTYGIWRTGGNPLMKYNDVWEQTSDYAGIAPGEGDLSVDPQFVDPAHGNFHLKRGSLCRNAGDPDAALEDYWEEELYVVGHERNDMGAYGGPLVTWRLDSDRDGLWDWTEDANHNGTLDSGETDPYDADTDDDGLVDGNTGSEDLNANGIFEPEQGETDPRNPDTDDDGILDGAEKGLALPETSDTNMAVFVADADPATVSNPLNPDTDGDGFSDGVEDANHDGALQAGEANPLDSASIPHPPVLAALSAGQRTDGSGLVEAVFTGVDQEGNLCTLPVKEVSLDGEGWLPLVWVGADPAHSAVEPMAFGVGGSVYTAVWNAREAFGAVEDPSVFVRMRPQDVSLAGETLVSGPFVLDTVAPTITLQVASLVNHPFVPDVTATDGLDTSPTIDFVLDGAPWAGGLISAEGSHSLGVLATDDFGNSSSTSVAFTIDTTPPLTQITVGEPKYQSTVLYVTSATQFQLTATDGLSGVANAQYRIDGGSLQPYGAFTIAAEGPHTIGYTCTDLAGNTESGNLQVVVTNSAPVTTINVGQPQHMGASLFIKGNTPITLTASGCFPGVGLSEYRIDSGDWKTYTSAFTLNGEGWSTDGSCSIEYRSRDTAGHTEVSQTLAARLDDTPPTVLVENDDINAVAEPSGTREIDIHGFVTDGEGYDPAPTVTWSEGDTILAHTADLSYRFAVGVHQLTFSATDHLGNSAVATARVNILNPIPLSSTPFVVEVDPSSGATSGPAAITVSGGNFEPGARLSLLGGGMRATGTCSTYGGPEDVHVQGNYAYIADWHGGLTVCDISDPSDPRAVGNVDTPGIAVSLDVSGNHVYLADNSYLRVFDISDPTSPVDCGTPLSFEGIDNSWDIEVAGNYAYIGLFGALMVADISDPCQPHKAALFSIGIPIVGVDVVGSYAYVVDTWWTIGQNLHVIDVSNPANPVLTGTLPLDFKSFYGLRDVEVANGHAFVVNGPALEVVDVGDPYNPILDLSFNALLDGTSIHISGGNAFIGAGYYGLQEIDLTDPHAPRLLGSLDLPGNSSLFDYSQGFTQSIFVPEGSDYAYVANDDGGLKVVDVSRPINPGPVASLAVGQATDIALSGSLAYIPDFNFGLRIVDVSNPESPVSVGSLPTSGYSSGVFVKDGYAYLAEDGHGLKIFDVADLANLHLEGSYYQSSMRPQKVFVLDNIAYIAGYYSVGLVDVSNPQNPVELGFASGQHANDIVAVEDTVQNRTYAYLARSAAQPDGSTNGLVIFDVTNPTLPTQVGFLRTPGTARGVFAVGTTAYLASESGGLQIIDVSVPSSPALVGSYPSISAHGVTVTGGLAYVTDDYNSSLRVFDVSDPAHPVQIASYGVPDSAIRAGVSGNYAFVADHKLGLQVIKLHSPIESVQVVDQGTISAVLPAGLGEGYHDLLVTNPGGEEGSLSNGYLVSSLSSFPWDLEIFALSATAAPSGAFSVTDTTRNIGPGPAPAAASATAFYLSADAFLDASDVKIGTRPVPPLDPGMTSVAVTSLVIPDGYPGLWYLIAKADDTNVLAEQDKVNNTLSTTINIQYQYTIAAATSGQGGVALDPADMFYPSGTTVTLAATAASGWHFDHWTGDLTGTMNPVQLLMDANKSATAVFVRNQYTLTVTTAGQGGVTLNPASGTYLSGTTVSLSATAAPGWHFDHWTGDLTGTSNPAQVLMDGNKSACAVFIQDQYTSLAVTASGQGSVTLDPAGGIYLSGTTVTLAATAAPGWHFDHWAADLNGTTNPAQLLMDGNKSATAVFVRDQYTLAVAASGPGSVALDPLGGTYLSDTTVTLTATADPGWHFDRWEGDLTGTTNPAQLLMDRSKSATAVFVQDQYALSVVISGQGGVTLDPAGGTCLSGSTVTLAATAATGWHFDRWEGDLTGATNPAELLMDGNKSATAIFVQDLYTLTATATGQGSVALVPAGETYLSGTTATLTATAAAGWRFDHWTGDLTGTTNPAQVLMDGDKSVTAVFAQDQYILAVATSGQGSVSPAGGTYPSGTTATLRATAAPGWHFDHWEGDLTGAANAAQLLMDGDKSATAIFVQPVSPNAGPTGSSVDVTLSGFNFQNGAQVSLLNGGPYVLGQLSGMSQGNGVFAAGDFAYVADGASGLRIVNVSNAKTPTLAAVYKDQSAQLNAMNVYVVGDRAYLNSVKSGGGSRLEIIDVTDRANPVRKGFADWSGSETRGIFVRGNLAYVTDYSNVNVFDISGDVPVLLNSVSGRGWRVMAVDVVVVNDKLYLSNRVPAIHDGGVYEYTLADDGVHHGTPELPVYTGRRAILDDAQGLSAGGGHIYAAISQGLAILDANSMQKVAEVPLPASGQDVHTASGFAYVAVGYGYFYVVDAREPTAPVVSGHVAAGGFARQVFVDGNRAYVAVALSGLSIVDIANHAADPPGVPPRQPSLAGSLGLAGTITGIAKGNDRAYLTADYVGVHVVGVGNPAGAVLEKTLTYSGPGGCRPQAITSAGGYLYVADKSWTVFILNPEASGTNPVVGSVVMPNHGPLTGIAVVGNYAYVTDTYYGLWIINISDPQNPVIAGRYASSNNGASGVAVSGDLAYVSWGTRGLRVINVANPAAPALVTTLDTPGDARGVSISGAYAYVADGGSGLHVVALGNPQAPTPAIVRTRSLPGLARSVLVSGTAAYVADGSGGLQVLDVSVPTSPWRVAAFHTPGAVGVTVEGQYIYVASSLSGGTGSIEVVRLSNPVTNATVVDSQTITATLPTGLPLGCYDLLVTNSDGSESVVPNAYQVKD